MKNKVIAENIKKSLIRRKRELIEKTQSFRKQAEKQEILLKNCIEDNIEITISKRRK